jgi:hypothetical protein|tara:strand:- start:42 stop:329 length:288 start_codon:yes stop_codon:yes gene_type:complete
MDSDLKNRKLGNMKSNLKKKNKREQTKSNLPFTGMYLFVELIKKQNISLLTHIANDKLITNAEREEFINRFNKINYQIPNIINNKKKELEQDIYA